MPLTDGLSFNWTFGDGASSGALSATHAYAALGTYQVTLTTTNTAGVATSASISCNDTSSPPRI